MMSRSREVKEFCESNGTRETYEAVIKRHVGV